MEKRRVITSYEKLSTELKQRVLVQYPEGYLDSVQKIDKPNGDFFYAFNLSTDDTVYMVKVKLNFDENLEELENSLYGTENTTQVESDSKHVQFDENEMYDE